MKLNKKQLTEIIDGNGELIGNDNIPNVDSNAETQANNTTDYNQKVGQQPFRYDMLGRFGFSLMPFMEGVENNDGFESIKYLGKELTNEIAKYLYDKNIKALKRYYKNPKAMQNEYRAKSKSNFENDESSQVEQRMAADILMIIEPHLKKSLDALEKNLNEHFQENLVEGKTAGK